MNQLDLPTKLFFTLNSVFYAASMACQFQLLFFSSFMLFGICIIFITSVSYLITHSMYIVLLIYGSILCVSVLFRYVLFAKEYMEKTFQSYSLWKMKYIPNERKGASTQLREIFKNYKVPKLKDIFSGIVRVLLIITDNMSLFIFFLLIAIAFGMVLCKMLGGTIMINAVGYTYLIFGWSALMLYFTMTLIIDFVSELYKTKRIVGTIPWLEVIPLCLPCSFLKLVVDILTSKCSEMAKKISNSLVTFILTILFLFFFVSLIVVTVDSASYGTTLVCYWIFFFVSIVSGFIPAIHALKRQQQSIPYSSFSIHLTTSGYQRVENELERQPEEIDSIDGEDLEVITLNTPEYDVNSKYEIFEQLRERLFGFKFESSLVLVVLFCLLFTLLLVVEMSTLSSLFQNAPSQRDIDINSDSLRATQEYSNFRSHLNELFYQNQVGLEGFEPSHYTKTTNIEDTTLQNSHLCSFDSYGISPKEYGYLSYLAYAKQLNETKGYELVYSYLQPKGWKVDFYVDESSLYYLVAHNTKLNLKVISFRGTYSIVDCIHDVQLFFESALPEMSVSIFPIFTDQVLSWISYALSYFGSQAFPRGSLYLIDIAKKAVLKQKSLDPSIPIVLTGHSLGGGIANIVGSDLGLLSFGISPPGIYLGRKSLGLKKQSISVLTQAVVPERDPVASLGANGGLQMSIPCYEHSAVCHNIDNSICMLGALCRDLELKSLCSADWERWGFEYASW